MSYMTVWMKLFSMSPVSEASLCCLALHLSGVLVTSLLQTVSLDPICLRRHHLVSTLPFLSKELERIALQQFLQHLESHSLLEPFQSTYRKCHSTENPLLRVVNDLLQVWDSVRVSILSLLDLSAAFDTTDHSTLITRLRAMFGCSFMVLVWFISCLSFHTHYVFVGHKSSPSFEMWSATRFCFGTSFVYFIIHTLSLPSFVCQVVYAISLQMIPSFIKQVFL